MKRLFSGLLFFFAGFVLSAQVIIGPIIQIRNLDGDENSIRVTDITTDVKVVGNIATTSIDLIIHNNASRTLEGEVDFSLQEGQSVVEYSLDINGKLRKSSVVEKDKGREVFDEVVRRSSDPGLLETTSGNNFKIRVYPILGGSNRHVQFVFQEEIGSKYVLNPLTDKKLDNYVFNMTVCKPNNQELSKSEFAQWNDAYNMHVEKKDYLFTGPVEIDLPSNSQALGVYTQTVGTDTYFYYCDNLKPNARPKPKSSSLGILFDVSGSAAKRDIDKEITLLKNYINANINEKAKIKVVLFRNEIWDSKEFSLSEVDSIEEYLKAQTFDGGTAIGNISFDKEFTSYDEILLFTDGLNNWGKTDIEKSSIPVNVITSAYSADYAFMKKIAQDSKGSYINLYNTTLEQALSLLCNQSYRIVKLEYNEEDIGEIYPTEGSEAAERFSLCGVLKKKNGTVKVSFGYGNEVTDVKEFAVSSVSENSEVDNILRLWAQKKIDELSVNYDKNKAEITQMAKKYKIVTKDTSLIVLDDIDDYIKYGIEPPEELLEEFSESYLLYKDTGSKSELQSIPSSVIKNFEEFKKWYNTKPGEFIKKKGIVSKSLSTGLSNVLTTNKVESSTRASAAVADYAWEDEMLSEEAEPSMQDNANGQSQNSGPQVSIMAWNPDAPYLSVLKKTSASLMYDKYLELKKDYENSPSFYMDVADYFWSEKLEKEALCIISNLCEIDLENADVLRALGNKLVEWKSREYAEIIFEKLVSLRPEIPEFYRDYALSLAENGKYQKAIETLYSIVLKNWDSRFSEIQQIVLNDMNAIIALHSKDVNTDFIDSRVKENFPVDIRIVLTWNTDDCDIDLWTTDPNDEKCYYNHKLTEIGGHNSRDFTRGYGPEEFCIKNAIKGSYKIEANYYGTQTQKIVQPVVVQAEVYTNFGKPNQKKEILTLRLESVKGSYLVGTIQF